MRSIGNMIKGLEIYMVKIVKLDILFYFLDDK